MKKIVSVVLVLLTLLGVVAVRAEEVGIIGALIGEEAVEEILESQESEAEKPKGRLDGLIIGIDPGHQRKANNGKEQVGPNSKEKKAKVASGTSGKKTGVPEYETNLQISLKLRDALLAEGATVVMTRDTNDVDISNRERAEIMNKAKCDIVLRIHCNGASKKSVNGTSLYIRKKCQLSKKEVPNPKELLAAEEKAADLLIKAMCAQTGAKNAGVHKRDTYTMNNWSKVPIILVECGYMSNYDEDVRLNTPSYQDKLCAGMVNGLAAYFTK